MKELFWDVVGGYNSQTWIIQIVFFMCGSILTGLIYRKTANYLSVIFKIFLASCFGWIAVVYFIILGSKHLNNYMNAVPFGVLSVLWISDIVLNKYEIERNKRYDKLVIVLYIVWFMFPVWSLLIGRSYPHMFLFMLPCQLVTYTLITMISFSQRTNYVILIILIGLAMGGIVNVLIFDVWEDIIMVITGLVAVIVFWREHRLSMQLVR